MFMNDVYKKEEIRSIAIKDLRSLGIKYRPKKSKHSQEAKNGKKLFKTSLALLPMQTVTLVTGQQLKVPKIVHELCSFILSKVETEGLFRKGGSKSRQNEIKLLLDAGCRLGDDHHEIDVANVLKTFLRELPEPLIPQCLHDVFLRCVLLETGKLEALLLACLLLPIENLNTFAYIMQFLHQVTECSYSNKMDSYNIAVCLGPSVLPIDDKVALNTQHRLKKWCELFQQLVEHADKIGILPENIIERIALSSSSGSLSDEEVGVKKKKKRRSGSLTRMFSGLRKMVSSRLNEDTEPTLVTPDLLITPRIHRSNKKRKPGIGHFSSKKKQELLSNLPGGALRTPITPARTPISNNPNATEKKSQWYSKPKTQKLRKLASSEKLTTEEPRRALERRWSAASQLASFKKNKKAVPAQKTASMSSIPATAESDDYVRVSKSEYEEIKSRVSEIERRISIELESVTEDYKVVDKNELDNIQTEYEKTKSLTQLSPTTDHLARQLSKNLKIRRSQEHPVIRSPSARKIGTIKRRSLENQKVRVTRNQSWHVTPSNTSRTNLKRNRRLSGTPEAKTQRKLSRTPSFKKVSTAENSWASAQDYFEQVTPSTGGSENSRASIARLRSQNAGMVLAKARLFENSAEKMKIAVEDIKKVTPPQRKRLRVCYVKQVDKENIVGKGASDLVREYPNIKKSLAVRSPKRLCHTPKLGEKMRTPLRATVSIRQQKF